MYINSEISFSHYQSLSLTKNKISNTIRYFTTKPYHEYIQNLDSTLLLCSYNLSKYKYNLSPRNNWGNWGRFQRCPFGSYAQGFQLKTEPYQGLFTDDTALNSVKLFCGDPYRPDTAVLTSTEGPWGEWGSVFSCYPGFLNGFQLRVEEYQGSGDDTATNNVRFFCTSLPNPSDYVEGDGLTYGSWSQAQHCYSNQVICGLQTQIEPYNGDDDDTSLNNVLMECCDYSKPADAKTEEMKSPEYNIPSSEVAINPKFASVKNLR
ncbi:unnamed protein product [Orchesella dallaii]|uniref:Vitelline membrane outer layer protein 1 n=1 Tax=Orchesella dallaii TaxID=48710 RepID=A0ABP1RJ63_9HEXA